MKRNTRKKIRVVIYIRYSSHRQADSFSIEYQLAECKKFCEQNGYDIVDIYIDEAKSGKKVAGRDQFDRMIYDAGLNKYDKIVVFSFSRSFRNTRDALNYNHDLHEKYGIVIQSVIEPIDMTNPHGKFSGTNLFAMHELQSDITAAHVRSGMYCAAQQGYYLGGYVPYGYELYGTGEFTRGKERKKYRPCESEANIVKEIFKLFAEGFTMDYIQRQLRDKQVLGRRGDIIGTTSIKTILKNPFYIGTRLYKVKGYDPLTIENATEPIIDIDTWNKVQAKFKTRKRVTPRKRDGHVYTLTGKIQCGECEGHYHGTYRYYHAANGKTYAYYLCSNKRLRKTCDARSVRKAELESYCMRKIKQHILNEDSMRTISSQIATAVGDTSSDMQERYNKAEKRKTKITAILKNIKKDIYEGEIPEEMGKEMAAEYESELHELDNTIATLKSALKSSVTPEGVYSYLQELLSFSESDDSDLVRMLFDKLIEKIVIYDDRVELYLVVSPFDYIGDNRLNGQPHCRLRIKAKKDELQ